MESNRSSSRLKQRLVRMLKPPSLLRSSCNSSTSAATNLSSTGSSRTLLRGVARDPVFVPGNHRHRGVDDDDDDDGMFLAHDSLGRSPSFSFANDRRHAASLMRFSVDCGGCRPSRDIPPLLAKREKGRHGKNKKKERRVRETGGFYETGEGEGRMCPPASPSSPSKSSSYCYCFNEVEQGGKKEEKSKKKQKKKKLLSNSYGFSSSSSMDSNDGFEFFTSEERELKEETEAFFSSRGFSSDSSEFYQRPNKKKKKNKKKPSRCPPRRRTKHHENPIASEGFQPLVSIASRKKKVRELEEEEEKRVFAVVKRSRDPYGDFRSSMVEMIMDRQIFGAEDLEKLLHYYLALNSRHNHPNILQAFSDIWVVLFGN